MHCNASFFYTQDMVTLYNVTEGTKKTLKITAIIFTLFFILFILIRIGTFLKEKISPTPPPPPTASFGKLPQQMFPLKKEKRNFTFSIDTVTGRLPELGDRATVYKNKIPEPSLLSLQNAENTVQSIGFSKTPARISETIYEWRNPDPPVRTITYDIVSGNFTYTSNFFTDPFATAGKTLPDEYKAIAKSEDFLSQLNALPEDIDSNKTKTSFYEIRNFTIVPTTSLSTAQVIRVDFYQKNINGLPVYYPNPPSSILYTLVASGEYDGQVVEARYFHQEKLEESATYPIKSAKEAFDQLQKGNGYIAVFPPPSVTSVSIKNISLGYYISDSLEEYLIPIIAIEGDNGFKAYVWAIKDEWIDK